MNVLNLFQKMSTHKQRENIILGNESIDSIRVIDNIVNQINRSSMTMSYLELIMQNSRYIS
jgi:hypothetical protein